MKPKKNLFIAFDAFGTLFHPRVPVAEQYRTVSREYDINLPTELSKISDAFGRAWKVESTKHPNYGKKTGMGPEKWWANVITQTLTPFLPPTQTIPNQLITHLYHQFSSKHGYALYPDVQPFFSMLRSPPPSWKWDKTVVGVITNSDNRVPAVLESLGLTVGSRRIGIPVSAEREKKTKNENEDKHDIDFVVLSYDVEKAKPDRQIFDAGVDMLREKLAGGGSEPSVDDFEKLYVGDEVEKDYVGAEAAGWNALYLQRGEGGLASRQSDGIEEMEVMIKNGDGDEVKKMVRTIKDLEQLQYWP